MSGFVSDFLLEYKSKSISGYFKHKGGMFGVNVFQCFVLVLEGWKHCEVILLRTDAARHHASSYQLIKDVTIMVFPATTMQICKGR